MPVNTGNREQKFFNALRDVFVGAKVEGESGYINLMRIKSRYYEEGVFPKLKQDINEALKPFSGFRDELFEKLYDFFHRYFSESGSIYFRYTPLHQNVYEKVYTNDKDVILFWKTHMLYYVKTDRLFKSLEVELDGQKFFFDASTLEHKKANEKRHIVYSFKEKRKDTLVFTVAYSEKGKNTDIEDIFKTLRKNEDNITEVLLERAFGVFAKQSEVDYFINKDAKAFLEEQFNLWLYQYVFSGESEWTQTRIKELQTLKDIAFKIIAFISQFEDELVKIWNKPKFVRNSNYVITLDKINNKKLIEEIFKAKGIKDQIKEWQELGIVDNSFKTKHALEDEKYKHLPVDTKYFKDLELNILSLFDDLDNQLDGWLIKSENYQALNTILPKFNGEVHTIYIDPPFNTGNDFYYADNYQNSSWLSIMSDRIRKAKLFLTSDSGNFFLHLDMNANYLGRIILNDIFGSDAIQNEIIWHYKSFHGQVEKYFPRKHDTISFFRNHPKAYFDLKRNEDISVEEMSDFKNWGKYIVNDNEIRGNYMPTDVRFKRYLDKWIKANGRQPNEDDVVYIFKSQSYDDVWDIRYIDPKDKTEKTGYDTQKPEALLKRILEAVSQSCDLIMDFFAGSGTTLAVAHKMKMKWIGVEVGKAFYEKYDTIKTFKKKRREDFEILEIIKENQSDITALVRLVGCLGRMKRVVGGYKCGISDKVKYSGGGFFKYYEMEQYEDTLQRVKYTDATLFEDPNKDAYHQYVFLRDLKMLETLDVDAKKNKVKVDLGKVYDGIDIAETLSNLTGKWIKSITADSVEFDDGEVVDTKNLDWKRIKQLIWW